MTQDKMQQQIKFDIEKNDGSAIGLEIVNKVCIASVVDINPRLAASFKPQSDELVSFVPMASVSEETMSIKNPIDRPRSVEF